MSGAATDGWRRVEDALPDDEIMVLGLSRRSFGAVPCIQYDGCWFTCWGGDWSPMELDPDWWIDLPEGWDS